VGVLKTNWDAAVDGRGKRIGIGVIVRDHEGGAMATLSETKDYIQDPATAEALAARRAVELSLNLGIRRLILEGDSLPIVQAIQEASGGQHMYELIIEDIKSLLRGITDCKVEFVPREDNGEAHKLAKLAFSMGENRVWREDFPCL
jgi:ribonuclease HI